MSSVMRMAVGVLGVIIVVLLAFWVFRMVKREIPNGS